MVSGAPVVRRGSLAEKELAPTLMIPMGKALGKECIMLGPPLLIKISYDTSTTPRPNVRGLGHRKGSKELAHWGAVNHYEERHFTLTKSPQPPTTEISSIKGPERSTGNKAEKGRPTAPS